MVLLPVSPPRTRRFSLPPPSVYPQPRLHTWERSSWSFTSHGRFNYVNLRGETYQQRSASNDTDEKVVGGWVGEGRDFLYISCKPYLAPLHRVHVHGRDAEASRVKMVHVDGVSQGRPEGKQRPHPVDQEQKHIHPAHTNRVRSEMNNGKSIVQRIVGRRGTG